MTDLQVLSICAIFAAASPHPIAKAQPLIEPFFMPALASSALGALFPAPLVLPGLGVTVTGANVGTALAAKSLLLASFAGGSALARTNSEENLPKVVSESHTRHLLHQRREGQTSISPDLVDSRQERRGHQSSPQETRVRESSHKKPIQHRKGGKADYLTYFGLKRSGKFPVYYGQLTEWFLCSILVQSFSFVFHSMIALNIYLQSFGWYKIYFCLFLDIKYFVQFHLKFNYISHDDEDRWMGGEKHIWDSFRISLWFRAPEKQL